MDNEKICKIGGNISQFGANGGKASWAGQELAKGSHRKRMSTGKCDYFFVYVSKSLLLKGI